MFPKSNPNRRFVYRVTPKYAGWPKNKGKYRGKIENIFHTSRIYESIIAIRESKFELLSGNAQIRAKSSIWKPCDIVPCNPEIWPMSLKPIGHLLYATSNCVHLFVNIDGVKVDLRSQMPNLGQFFLPLLPWHLTSDLDLFTTETVWKCVTPRQTD